jgi:hypothetical protein
MLDCVARKRLPADDNYACADDLITFLRRLEAEQILAGRRGAAPAVADAHAPERLRRLARDTAPRWCVLVPHLAKRRAVRTRACVGPAPMFVRSFLR